MKLAPIHLIAAVLASLMLLPAQAAGSTADRLLSLVPADAVSVGMIRVDDMRRSPSAQSLFARMSAGAVDADVERLLRETGLRPEEDVDAIVVALSIPSTSERPRVLVAASGRFDPVRLGNVAESRGGVRKSAAGTAYFAGPEGAQPAVSFYDRGLVLAGSEDAVVAAINALRNGEDRFLASPLRREMFRIHPRASGWMLIDVQRAPARAFDDQPLAAIRNVSTVSLWVVETGEGVEFGSAAVAADAETRALVQDVLKGLLATLRMAAQEKQPELVKIVRRFTVAADATAVSLNGSVPAAMVHDFIAGMK